MFIMCFPEDIAPEECQCCGGWLFAGGPQTFGDDRYCSSECLEDAIKAGWYKEENDGVRG